MIRLSQSRKLQDKTLWSQKHNCQRPLEEPIFKNHQRRGSRLSDLSWTSCKTKNQKFFEYRHIFTFWLNHSGLRPIQKWNLFSCSSLLSFSFIWFCLQIPCLNNHFQQYFNFILILLLELKWEGPRIQESKVWINEHFPSN